MTDVRVVIVSWNTRELLERALDALRDDTTAGRCEVVVVDNDSHDGSPEAVAARPWATLRPAGANVGYGQAVNLGARDAATPFVVAANADTAVRPGALAALVAAARAHPAAGVLAPRLLLPDGSTQHHVHPFPSITTTAAVALALGPLVGRRLTLEGHWDPDGAREVDWAHGAFLLFAHDAFEAIGGFDETMFMYAEDLDVCWRMRRHGRTVRYVPAAHVEHARSAATEQAWGAARDDRAQAAAYAWMARRLGAPRTRAIAAVAYAGAVARARAHRDPAARQAAGAWALRHRAALRARH